MATTEDSDVPETGAVFTFGKSNFADNLPNKFWVKNDRVTHVACGDEHTALVVESGRVFMFGLNDWGQLGLGHDIRPGVNKPSCIKTLKHEKSKLVACGRSHTIISTVSGHIYSFGNNSEGQLGIRDVADPYIPRCIDSLEPTNYKMLTAGSDSSVALTADGRVFVWGGNEDGKLGLGELVETAYEPELLEFERRVVCVACGYYHTAVVTDDGKLYTMGEAEGGKLGLPEDIENTKVPQHVTAIPDPVKWVACGSSHTVALTEFGECYVFGEGENGQLGLGTEILSTSTPTHLPLPFKVSRVFCGQNFTALISEKGQLYTFGDGRHGKLAHGSDQYSNLYKPFHCKRFCHFIVDRASCGGCHMIVTARTKISDGKVEDDDEADEMKSFESKSSSDSLGRLDGSPSLTRSLSARERRRIEWQKSFSNMSDLLPALTAYRKQSSLSSTMPIVKSRPKINGDPLNKTMIPKIEAIPNGKTPHKGSPEESESEGGTDAEEKKTTNKVPPMASPRQKLSQLQDGSDGDDENDSDGDEEVDVKSDEDKHKKNKTKGSSTNEDSNEMNDIRTLESEHESDKDNELEQEEENVQEEDGLNQENIDEKADETTEQSSDNERESSVEQVATEELLVEKQPQVPAVLPRRKKEQKNKQKETEEEEEEDSAKEENDKKHQDEEKEKDHKKDKKKKKNEEEDVEKQKGKKEVKKKKKKDEEGELEEEENNNKAKGKKNKKKEDTDKRKKKDKGDEVKEDEKTDKKIEKPKRKNKKKENADDNDKIKVDEEKNEGGKKNKEETEDHNKGKNGKDKDNKTDDKKITEETPRGKDKNQATKASPPKKSRFCVIL